MNFSFHHGTAAPLYRVSLDSAVVRGYRDTKTFADMLTDLRPSAALIGPGLGAGTLAAREKTLAVLRSGLPAVLDADALSLFEETTDLLIEGRSGPKNRTAPAVPSTMFGVHRAGITGTRPFWASASAPASRR